MYYNLFVHLPTEGLLGSVVSEGEGDGIITKMLLWMFFVHLWGTNVLEYTHTYSWREKSRWVDVVVVESLSCIQLLWPHGLEHTRLLCPLLSLGVRSDYCPLSWWCYPLPPPPPFAFNFFSIRVFSMSLLFASSGQSIRASALVLPMNIQGWFPLELTGLISLLSKGLSRVFISTTVWKHQFFDA